MQALVHPSYFLQLVTMWPWSERYFLFEVEDNFRSKTNRNRAYIYSPNGIQLNIPIKHSKAPHKNNKDIIVDNTSD
jgi:hypothetical protein